LRLFDEPLRIEMERGVLNILLLFADHPLSISMRWWWFLVLQQPRLAWAVNERVEQVRSDYFCDVQGSSRYCAAPGSSNECLAQALRPIPPRLPGCSPPLSCCCRYGVTSRTLRLSRGHHLRRLAFDRISRIRLKTFPPLRRVGRGAGENCRLQQSLRPLELTEKEVVKETEGEGVLIA
jgi:hypothetical protein